MKMTPLDDLINSIVNRAIPDRGQKMSNAAMFGQVLRFTGQVEMYVLEAVDYAYVFHKGQNNDFDEAAQMLAFLQMTCFVEISLSGINHGITEIDIRAANAELWYKRFRNRIDPDHNFYTH